MIGEKDVRRYLETLRNLKSQYTFFDVHAHPVEIIFNSFDYFPNPGQEGVYSIHSTLYRSPRLTALGSESTSGGKHSPRDHRESGISLINLRRIYSHTGPKVFNDHMELSGIDQVLLLPVAPSTDGADNPLERIAEIFGADKRFSLGCSVPNAIEDREIRRFVREKISQFKIKAIKLHPNITETNLGSKRGKERVEGILEACREFRLPLIVHGGRSPVLRNHETAEYGYIRNLEDIDWSVAEETVVVAHAGGYCCNKMEMENDVLPRIEKLLSRHSNLMIDISGLEIEILVTVLSKIDVNRVLFGSDALYEDEWAAVVKMIYAIKREGMKLEETLIKIASANPGKFIFERAEIA